jgi:hypothetical protein
MDSANPEIQPQQIYSNYAVALPPSTVTNTFEGGTATVVVDINGAVGPVITLATTVAGLTWSTSGSTITLSGAVTQIRESSGPTTLDIDAIPDQTFLFRDGTDVIGVATAPPAALDVQTITFADTPYSLTDANDVLLVDATGGVVEVDLPSGSTAFQKPYIIKKIDASINAVNVNAAGADVIDGAGTQTTIIQYESFSIVPDNATGDWSIV